MPDKFFVSSTVNEPEISTLSELIRCETFGAEVNLGSWLQSLLLDKNLRLLQNQAK